MRVSGPNRKRGGLFARQCWRPSAHFQESQHAGVTEPQDQAEKGKIKNVRQCLDRTEHRTREKRKKGKNTKKASSCVKNDESGTKDPWKSGTKAYTNDEGTETIYRTTKEDTVHGTMETKDGNSNVALKSVTCDK